MVVTEISEFRLNILPLKLAKTQNFNKVLIVEDEALVALEMGLYKFYSKRKTRLNEKSFLQFSDQIEDAFFISDKSDEKTLFASKGFEKVLEEIRINLFKAPNLF